MEMKKSILIVDDNENICETLKLILIKKGYETEVAKTGKEAIKKIKKRSFNIALIDIKLPDIEGIKILKLLKNLHPEMEVIVITGYASLDVAMSSLNEGASVMMTKPLNIDFLLSKIKNIFEKQYLISEKRQVEKELKDSEKFYRSILDGIINGVWVTSKDDIIYYTNKGMEKIAGIKSNQIIGARVLCDFPETTLKYFKPYYLKAKEKLKPVFYKAVPVETPASCYSYQSGWLIPLIKDGIFNGMICTVDDVTEQIKAEDKIKEQNKFLINAIESLGHPFYVINANDYTIELTNKSAKLGTFNKNSTCYSLTHNQDKPCGNENYCPLEMVKKTKKPVSVEHFHFDNEGSRTCMEVHGYPILDKDGNVDKLIISTFDITERKKSEQKIRESEDKYRYLSNELELKVIKRTKELHESREKYRELFDNIGSGVAIYETIDDGTTFIFKNINKTGEKISKIKKSGIVGRNLMDLFPGVIPTGLYDTIKKVYKTGKPENHPVTLYKDKRIQHWMENYVYKLPTGEIVAVYNDITDKMLAEQSLIESEKKFKYLANEFEMILDHIPGIVLYKDTENNLLRVNKFHADAHNISKEELEGVSCFELYPKEQAQAYWEDDLEVIRSRKPKLNIVEPWETKNAERWVNMNKIPYIDEDGDVKGIIAIALDITKSKQAEEKIRESESKFRMIFNTSNDILFINDLDGNFLEANQTSYERLGYTRNELLQMTPLDIDTPYYSSKVAERINELKKIGNILFETAHVCKDGKVIQTEINSKIITFEGKAAILSIARDITKRKLAEKKLKESEEKLKKFMESATDSFILFDSELNYIDFNEATLRILGVTKEELVGKNILDIAPNLKETGRYDKYLDVIKTGKPFITDDAIYNRLDGSLSLYLSVRAFKAGENLGVLTTDITARKKREKEAHLHSQIMTNMSEGVYLIRIVDGTIVYTNPRLEEMFGYNPGEIIGKHVSIVNAPADKDPEDKAEEILGILEEKGQWHGEILNIKKDGTQFWCYANVSTFDHPEYGTVIVSIHTDITERKNTEEEMRLQSEIMTNMAEGVYLVRINDGIIAYTNPKFEKMFGYNQGEMIGKHVSIVNAPTEKTPEETAEEIVGVLERTGEWHGEVKNIKKDGTPFWCFANVSVFNHPEYGEVLVAVHTDITERKKKDKEIHLQSKMMENLNEGVNLIRASNLLIVYANPRFEEMFGYNPGEIIGKHVTIINAPTDKSPEETAREILITIEETGEWHGEINNIKKDGTSVWCYANVSTFDHPEYGRVFVSILTDITERKKTEKKIADLARFPSENPNPVLRVSKDEVLYINKVGQILFDIEKSDRIPGILEDIILKAFSENKIRSIEAEIKNRTYSFVISPIKNVGYANIYGRDITERKKREKEAHLHSQIMTNMSEGVYLIRIVDGTIVYTNPRLEEMFGYNPGEIIGKHVSIVNAPADKDPEDKAEEILGILEEKGHWHGEILNIKKDGTQFWCYSNVSTFDHPEYGTVIASINTDITERKKIKKEIIDLSRFPSENPNPVLRVNKENVIYINNAGLRVFNINKGEMIPSELKDIVDEAFMKNKTLNLETRLNDKIYLFDITPIQEGGYVNIYGRDINELKLAEQKLKESEEKFRKMFTGSPIAITLYDSDAKLIDANKACLDLINVTDVEKIKGFDLFQDPNLPNYAKDQLKNNQSVRFEIQYDFDEVEDSLKANRYGTLFCDASITPIKKEDGSVIYYLNQVQDISERKQAENLIKEEIKKLSELDRIKSKFIYRASHELKTPLNSIMSASTILLDTCKDYLERNDIKLLEVINKGGKRLEKLAQDLLDALKLESNVLDLKKEEINVIKLIKSIFNDLGSLLLERNLTINSNTNENIMVLVDKNRIEQVIINILTNAINNTPPMGKISVLLDLKDNFVDIKINDNGIGFTEEEMGKIFKKFGKIERSGMGMDINTEGTGLGLYISREIVELHGGEIWVESEGRNKGTKVTIRLPRNKE